MAVNGSDDAETINKYIAENKFTFQVGMADKRQGATYDVAAKYGVSAYPTNYLVDALTGKVLWRGVGFDEKAIRDALAQVNVK